MSNSVSIPETCPEGHESDPGAVLLADNAAYVNRTATIAGTCPQCGKPRTIAPGTYTLRDGSIVREELPAVSGLLAPFFEGGTLRA